MQIFFIQDLVFFLNLNWTCLLWIMQMGCYLWLNIVFFVQANIIAELAVVSCSSVLLYLLSTRQEKGSAKTDKGREKVFSITKAETEKT